MTTEQTALEYDDIQRWESRGLKFTRRGGTLLRDGNGCYHVRARLMVDGLGCGLGIGFMRFSASEGDRYNFEPWQIQFGKDRLWFEEKDVTVATFLEYCFRTKGALGGTPWLFVGLLLAACVRLSMITWWMGAAEMLVFVAFTYCNYKFWFR